MRCPRGAEESIVAEMRWEQCGHANLKLMLGESFEEFPDIPFSESRQAEFG